MNLPPNLDLGKLIEEIGPLNNQIRTANGYKKLALLWDVGDILFQHKIEQVHPVGWAIQGKSYITRTLLIYSYRIRRKWTTKAELRRTFGRLTSFTAFREALPLIENKKFALPIPMVHQLIRALNTEAPIPLKKKILAMKAKVINIHNDRSRRLTEVRSEANAFNNTYKKLTEIIATQDEHKAARIKTEIGSADLIKISQVCMSLSNDSYIGPKEVSLKGNPSLVIDFVQALLPLSLKDKETKARFRRLVDANKITLLADIFNSFALNLSLKEIKSRLRL